MSLGNYGIGILRLPAKRQSNNDRSKLNLTHHIVRSPNLFRYKHPAKISGLRLLRPYSRLAAAFLHLRATPRLPDIL